MEFKHVVFSGAGTIHTTPVTVENVSALVGDRPRNVLLPPQWEQRYNHITSTGLRELLDSRDDPAPTCEHYVLDNYSDNHQNTLVFPCISKDVGYGMKWSRRSQSWNSSRQFRLRWKPRHSCTANNNPPTPMPTPILSSLTRLLHHTVVTSM